MARFTVPGTYHTSDSLGERAVDSISDCETRPGGSVCQCVYMCVCKGFLIMQICYFPLHQSVGLITVIKTWVIILYHDTWRHDTHLSLYETLHFTFVPHPGVRVTEQVLALQFFTAHPYTFISRMFRFRFEHTHQNHQKCLMKFHTTEVWV